MSAPWQLVSCAACACAVPGCCFLAGTPHISVPLRAMRATRAARAQEGHGLGPEVVKNRVQCACQGKQTLLHAWHRAAADVLFSGMLEASGAAVEEWVLLPEFEARLFSYFPCTNITHALANKVRGGAFTPSPRAWPVMLRCCPCLQCADDATSLAGSMTCNLWW